MRHRGLSFAALAAAAVLLTACGSTDDAGSASSAAASTASAASMSAGQSAVTITDTWVKATAGAEETTMTAAFGLLSNASDADRTIVSATTSASPRAELHEMATVDGAMVMREIAGGIVIPAGGTVALEPGGLHVMVMDATKELAPGDEVDVTLTLDDGSTVAFTALAKEFAGANEEYSGGHGDMTGMDHGDMSEMDHGTTESSHG